MPRPYNVGVFYLRDIDDNGHRIGDFVQGAGLFDDDSSCNDGIFEQ